MLVIMKSTSTVPSDRNLPVGISNSSRMGSPAEWPGAVEPGNGPRDLKGGEGCLIASMVNSSCDNVTTPPSRNRKRNAIKPESNVQRFNVLLIETQARAIN